MNNITKDEILDYMSVDGLKGYRSYLEKSIKAIDAMIEKASKNESDEIPDMIDICEDKTYFTVFGRDGGGVSCGCVPRLHNDLRSDAYFHLAFEEKHLKAAEILRKQIQLKADIMHCKVFLEPDRLDVNDGYGIAFDPANGRFAANYIEFPDDGFQTVTRFVKLENAATCAKWLNKRWFGEDD